MEFIFQLLAQLFGNVEDDLNMTTGVNHEVCQPAEDISCFETEKEIEPIPHPNFFTGISFH
jgi:hypothetical protein